MIRLNNSIAYVLDLDASKVIEAVRSTGATITPAMMHYAHYLISNMKNIGTWQLSNAVYGFVGGTAASHKFNWKDLRDVDAAFRLTYPNGMTHSSLGIQGNGTNQYANTFLTPSTSLTLNNTHLSIYSRTNSDGVFCDIGAANTSAPSNAMTIYIRLNNKLYTDAYQNSINGRIITDNFDSKGYYISNRLSATSFKVFKNERLLTSINLSAGILPTNNIFIGALNDAALGGSILQFSGRQYSFSTIGAGLTDTQAIQQSQIVTNAQNILNRA